MDALSARPASIHCAERLVLSALTGIPIVEPGQDVPALICAALERCGISPATGRDVVVVTSKVLSRAEGRFVRLADIAVTERAAELARAVEKDPRLCQLILDESSAVSRTARGVIVVRHRLGFISANAGIDESNVRGENQDTVLLLPRDPDASARAIRQAIRARFAADIGVVISDSFGRPFRVGTVGAAIGVSGLPPLWDQRGGADLHGRRLQHTITALADQVAAAADLVAGQADEGRAAVHVSGLVFEPQDDGGAGALLRAPEQDLYA
jgi:coenzyme F420-0:L-glutamate ligase/coenzyme F420-1:gamma-L-glutamate ligase